MDSDRRVRHRYGLRGNMGVGNRERKCVHECVRTKGKKKKKREVGRWGGGDEEGLAFCFIYPFSSSRNPG